MVVQFGVIRPESPAGQYEKDREHMERRPTASLGYPLQIIPIKVGAKSSTVVQSVLDKGFDSLVIIEFGMKARTGAARR